MINFDGVDFSGCRSEEVMFILMLGVVTSSETRKQNSQEIYIALQSQFWIACLLADSFVIVLKVMKYWYQSHQQQVCRSMEYNMLYLMHTFVPLKHYNYYEYNINAKSFTAVVQGPLKRALEALGAQILSHAIWTSRTILIKHGGGGGEAIKIVGGCTPVAPPSGSATEKRHTVRAPAFSTLNSVISNFQTSFIVKTALEVSNYCWM